MQVKDWDEYFLDIADVVRTKSKDPSSQIGCVIVSADRQILSTGYNGFPRGIEDSDERYNDRPTKYKFVAHAERNAIDQAAREGISLKGATLYISAFGPPNVPCTECAKSVIQAGIVRVVGRPTKPAQDSWMESLIFARDMLTEAGVVCVDIPAKKSPVRLLSDEIDKIMCTYFEDSDVHPNAREEIYQALNKSIGL